MSSLDVLVLGGTLYFGRAVVEELLEAGHRVTVFSRGRLRPPFWDSVEHIEGDRTDADGLVERLGGRTFDGVIDNICYNRGEAESVVRAQRGPVGRYVAASTVSVYGEAGHAIHRHTPTRPLSDEARFAVGVSNAVLAVIGMQIGAVLANAAVLIVFAPCLRTLDIGAWRVDSQLAGIQRGSRSVL